MPRRLCASGAFCLLVFAATPARSQTGPEFRVNTYTSASQALPEIAADGNGNFVVVWESTGQDGSLDGIFAQRFTWSGAPRGAEFRVNVPTAGSQNTVHVAATPAGAFVVVWNSYFQDGDSGGLFARRYDASGLAAGSEFPINAYTTGGQGLGRVAVGPAGNFVVTWSGVGSSGSNSDVWLRRFDASGTPLGGDFRVNTYTTGRQYPGAIAMHASGNFVIVWKGENSQDGNGDGVFLRRFDAAGTPLGASDFPVNIYTTSAQRDPDVAYDAAGNFVVVWSSSGQDGSLGTVIARLFSAAGTPLTGELQLNTYTSSEQSHPRVARAADGRFAVVWRSSFQDGSDAGVFGRLLDANGNPLSGEFRVNTYTTANQLFPEVAANLDGDFVVTWESTGQDGSYGGVYAQRYGDLIFQDDFESGALALWASASADGFDLDASGAAALAGTGVGLQAFVDDANPLYVQDDTPSAESRYRVRFYIDPNSFDPGETDGKRRVRVFIAFNGGGQRVVTIVLRRLSGVYSLQARTRRDDGTRADTGFFDISNAPHFVEFDWRRATAAGANNGSLLFYLDDTPVSNLSGLDNDLSTIESARLGVMTIKTPAAGGSVLFDQFESRRVRYIGAE